VFTARYALSPYIKQIRFFFKGLILHFPLLTSFASGSILPIFATKFFRHFASVKWMPHVLHISTLLIRSTSHLAMFTNYEAPHCAVFSSLLLFAPFWRTDSFILFVNTALGAITVLHREVKLASCVIYSHLSKLFNSHTGYVNTIRLLFAGAGLWCNSLYCILPILFNLALKLIRISFSS
jgi:hypothetical protein